MEEKINGIYIKLLECASKATFIGEDELLEYDSELKNIIRKIVEDGNDYLLTNGFLHFLISDALHYTSLLSLGDLVQNDLANINDLNMKYVIISKYIYAITNSIDLDDYLNISEKGIVRIYDDILLHNFYGTPNKEYFLIRNIFEILGAYIVINKKSHDEYKYMLKKYIANLRNNLDDVLMQLNMDYDYEHDCYKFNYCELVQFVLSKIGENDKKEIR